MSTLLGDIVKITNDRTSGSVALVNNLVEAISTSSSDQLSEVEIDILQKFVQREKQFVVFSHFVRELLTSHQSSIKIVAVDYRDRWKEISDSMTASACNKLQSFSNYLTHSHSETIISFFNAFILVNPAVNIFQTISEPGREGIIQGERMSKIGCNVQMIDDIPEEHMLDQVELFLCGADAIGPTSFINKSGTLTLAQKMNKLGKPVIVLADPRKQVKDSAEFASICDSLGDSFEEIPAGLVSAFIPGD